MSTLNIPLFYRRTKRHPYSIPIFYYLCAIVNPQLLEVPISRTNFHGPKDVRATEVKHEVTNFIFLEKKKKKKKTAKNILSISSHLTRLFEELFVSVNEL